MLFQQFYNCADTSTIRTLYLMLIKATSRVCKPSLGSIPCQGLQFVGRCSEVCLQGVSKELEHNI